MDVISHNDSFTTCDRQLLVMDAVLCCWVMISFMQFILTKNTEVIYPIHMYSGITTSRVLDGELLYKKILEANLFAFAYRLFHEDFYPIDGTLPIDWREIFMKQSVGKCKQITF